MTVSPLEPLNTILSVPITKDDLAEMNDGPYDESFIEEFDKAWNNFLKDYPIPKGEREERILELQIKAKEIEASKENVERELKRQAAFFRSSREDLERTYATKIQHTMDQQRSVNEELSKVIEGIVAADQIQSQTLPWLHFIKELDSLIASSANDSESASTNNERSIKTAKPSSRAMYLTELVLKDLDLPHEQKQLQSYRIDQALLRTNVTMIQKEIERYERLLDCQPFVAQLLADIDAWGMFQSDASSIADTTVSAVTIPIQISDDNHNKH